MEELGHDVIFVNLHECGVKMENTEVFSYKQFRAAWHMPSRAGYV